MIVIDVGCARIGGDYSIERLVEMFKPHTLYGFDPNEPMGMAKMVGSTNVFVNIEASVAWVYDGEVGFTGEGLIAHVDEEAETKVSCLDLARFITDLPLGPVVLKLDAETAEYDLLEHLIAHNVVGQLERILVEWHPTGQGQRRHAIEMALRESGVPTEQWKW